ncbi:MAG: ferritin-like domain-containing protein [Nitriliruptorales bacterium]|nr:ferritin-like domain-containing protein [Nitriliruptorales bacterium]
MIDREKFVQLLNEDLGTEYQSIVQYVTHIATLRGGEFQGLADELADHLDQELQHALTLARQIDFLGGVPTTEVPAVQHHDDTRTALESDLDLERRQLDRYRDRVAQADEMGLPDVAEALSPVLEQTQDHVHELARALE